MDDPTFDDDPGPVDGLFRLAGRLIHGGTHFGEFVRTMRAAAPTLAPSMFPPDHGNAEAVARAAGGFAFGLWRAMPSPHHGWRPPQTPLPGRNDPCYCGSGQKYKRCCGSLPIPTAVLQEVNLLRFVLDACTGKELGTLDLHRIDPVALGDTAAQWVEEGEEKRAAQLLEPLFREHDRLSARHVEAFDALMSAWLALDRPRKRKDLVNALVRHPDAELANAARQREITMLADQGSLDAAWSRFHELMRLTPEDPPLAHLEITLLKLQQRDDEAIARAEFWSRRLRQIDPRLAAYGDHLLAMASDADNALPGDQGKPPFVLLCERLLQDAPAAEGSHAAPVRGGVIELVPSRELERVERAWRQEFPVPEPVLTSLETESEFVIERLPAVVSFLEKHPLAWQSFQVLGDLGLVAHAIGLLEPLDRPWLVLQRKLGERAERLLACMLPEALQPPPTLVEDSAAASAQLLSHLGSAGATLPWAVHENRPALRLVALQINARQHLRLGDPRIESLMAWFLRLNPDDNHGYRSLLAQRWLREARAADALSLLDRYPDDGGAALADRILALYLLGRIDEAGALLESDGRWIIEIVLALCAASYRRPKELDDEFITVGGPGEAWVYREAMRPTWERCGALGWLKERSGRIQRGRASPESEVTTARDQKRRPGRRTPDAALTEPVTSAESGLSSASEAGNAITTARDRFAEIGGDPVRAHGSLVATALAPAIGSPTGWISALLRPKNEPAPAFSSIEDAQLVLAGFTAWYNNIVMEVGPASHPGPRIGEHATPWLGEPSSGAVSRWAAGFMSSVVAEPAAWVVLRPYPELLAPLRKLATQAPLTAAEKADPSRIRDRGDEDAPLLAAVDNADPVALLVSALERLAQTVGRVREEAGPRRR
jgi:hypothetical protein